MSTVNKVTLALYALAALGLSAFATAWTIGNWEEGVFSSPGDFAASAIPAVILLLVVAVFQFKAGFRAWLAVLLAGAFSTLGLTWASHLGGPIYNLAGLAHCVVLIVALGLIGLFWRGRSSSDS